MMLIKSPPAPALSERLAGGDFLTVARLIVQCMRRVSASLLSSCLPEDAFTTQDRDLLSFACCTALPNIHISNLPMNIFYLHLHLSLHQPVSTSPPTSFTTFPTTFPFHFIQLQNPLLFFASLSASALTTPLCASSHRATQFVAHEVSRESKAPCDMRPVMHFFQHVSAREWTTACRKVSWDTISTVEGGKRVANEMYLDVGRGEQRMEG